MGSFGKLISAMRLSFCFNIHPSIHPTHPMLFHAIALPHPSNPSNQSQAIPSTQSILSVYPIHHPSLPPSISPTSLSHPSIHPIQTMQSIHSMTCHFIPASQSNSFILSIHLIHPSISLNLSHPSMLSHSIPPSIFPIHQSILSVHPIHHLSLPPLPPFLQPVHPIHPPNLLYAIQCHPSIPAF